MSSTYNQVLLIENQLDQIRNNLVSQVNDYIDQTILDTFDDVLMFLSGFGQFFCRDRDERDEEKKFPHSNVSTHPCVCSYENQIILAPMTRDCDYDEMFYAMSKSVFQEVIEKVNTKICDRFWPTADDLNVWLAVDGTDPICDMVIYHMDVLTKIEMEDEIV